MQKVEVGQEDMINKCTIFYLLQSLEEWFHVFLLQPLPPNQRKKASHKTLLHQPVKNTTNKMDLIRFLHKEPEKLKVMLFCNDIWHVAAAAALVYFVYHNKKDQFSKSPYVSRGNTKTNKNWFADNPRVSESEAQDFKHKVSCNISTMGELANSHWTKPELLKAPQSCSLLFWMHRWIEKVLIAISRGFCFAIRSTILLVDESVQEGEKNTQRRKQANSLSPVDWCQSPLAEMPPRR